MRSADPSARIVDVVRDAARKPADGFELLRLPQLFFELTAFGDVAEEPRHRARVLGAHARDRQFDGELRAVGAHGDDLHLASGQRATAGGEVLAQRFDRRGPVTADDRRGVDGPPSMSMRR
jgi:hypothetical protein